MLAGMILGAAAVVAALMFFHIGDSARGGERQRFRYSVIGLVIAVAIGAAVMITVSDGDGRAASPRLAGVSVDDLARASSSLPGGSLPGASLPGSSLPRSNPASAQTEPGKVASVPSLVSGLEKRLQSNPDDAGGWALLAQSYSFIGKADDAERAMARAVSLGADEAELRSRIASARRDPHAGVPGAPPLD